MEFEIINKEYLHKITTRKTNKQKKKRSSQNGKNSKEPCNQPILSK